MHQCQGVTASGSSGGSWSHCTKVKKPDCNCRNAKRAAHCPFHLGPDPLAREWACPQLRCVSPCQQHDGDHLLLACPKAHIPGDSRHWDLSALTIMTVSWPAGNIQLSMILCTGHTKGLLLSVLVASFNSEGTGLVLG